MGHLSVLRELSDHALQRDLAQLARHRRQLLALAAETNELTERLDEEAKNSPAGPDIWRAGVLARFAEFTNQRRAETAEKRVELEAVETEAHAAAQRAYMRRRAIEMLQAKANEQERARAARKDEQSMIR